MPIISSRRSFLGGLAALFAAPAIVRASNLMPVRNIDRLILPGYEFESFDQGIPYGVEYQWVAKTVMGDESLGQYGLMEKSGWRDVPVQRYAGKFLIHGGQIEHGGCVLMERVKRMKARNEAIDDANAMVDNWKKRWESPLPWGPKFTVEIRQSAERTFDDTWESPGDFSGINRLGSPDEWHPANQIKDKSS